MPRKGKSGIANVTSPSTANISYGHQVITTPIGKFSEEDYLRKYGFRRPDQDSIAAPDKLSNIQTGPDNSPKSLRDLKKNHPKGTSMKRRKRTRRRSSIKKRTKRHTKRRRSSRRRSSRRRSSRRRSSRK